MKVGSSPIYYLPGQEKQLESFSKYLKDKEKEAFMLLQEKKFLQDRKQEPAIRVALRAIKDFAKYFQPQEGGEGYWRYFIVPEDEFYNKKSTNKETSSEKLSNPEKEENPETKKKEEKVQEESKAGEENKNDVKDTKTEKEDKKESEENEKQSTKHNIFESADNTHKKSEEGKTQKKIKSSGNKKEKPEFVKEVLEYLNKNNLNVKQEISFKKKEYQAIIQVNSDIGPIDFFLLAKGKKKISTDDVIDVINETKEKKLYALLLYSDEIQNKAEDFAKENSSILKIKKIE